MVHIAIVGPSHPWRGGIAHHTARLYEAVEAAGHRATLINFSRLYPSLLFPGRSQLDDSERPISAPAQQVYDPVDPRRWWAVGRQIQRERPDRLVLQWWHPFFAPGYAAICALAALAGVEVVMVCHNVQPHESTPVDRMLLRLAYALPARFITQSEVERGRLQALLGRASGQQTNDQTRPIDVIGHPPYDVFSARTPADERAGKPAAYRDVIADHVIVFFGLIRPYKGVDLLVEAVAQLPDDLDWQLVIAGEVYGDPAPYRHQIRRLGLQERVRLDDRYLPNEEVADLFEVADLCVLPYRHATGSGAANAALGCQVELVMSRLETLEQAFGDDPVRWFRPGDPMALRDAIVAGLTDSSDHGTHKIASRDADTTWRQLVDAIVR